MTAGASDSIRGAGAGIGSGAAGDVDGGALATRVHDALRVGIHWCVLRVACCVLRVACCVLRAACDNQACASWTLRGVVYELQFVPLGGMF